MTTKTAMLIMMVLMEMTITARVEEVVSTTHTIKRFVMPIELTVVLVVAVVYMVTPLAQAVAHLLLYLQLLRL